MPLLFACSKIGKAPSGSRRILAVGSLFEVFYIPLGALEPEPEAPVPEAPEEPPPPACPACPLRSSCSPTGDYKYIHEHEEPDGRFTYGNQGLTLPGAGEREYKGLLPGQCACCYYRNREILEWTSNGPGYLALMTPGWYIDEHGHWKWWHGDALHGRPGWTCRNHNNDEDLEDPEVWEQIQIEQTLENPENLGAASSSGVPVDPAEPGVRADP